MKFTFVYATLLMLAAVAVLGYVLQSRRGGPSDPTKTLKVWCATSARFPMSRLLKEYELQHGVEIDVIYAGSGDLLRKLPDAAQVDVLIAGDISYFDELKGARPPLVKEVVPLASMRPVIVVKQGNPRRVEDFERLLRPDLKVSLPNPEKTSLGRVLQTVLGPARWSELWDQRLSGRDSASDVANDVKLGVTDAGIVWNTTLRELPDLEGVECPELQSARGSVSIGVLERSEHRAQAAHLALFLASPHGLKTFEKYGFSPIVAESPR